MKKLLLILFLALTLHSNSQEIRVMTFNIRYDNPSDSIYSWKNRKQMVFKVLRHEKPDIIGTQEVLKNQADDILQAFSEYGFSGVGRDDGMEKGEFSAIFYRKSRFTKEAGSTFWLSEKPDVPGSKSWRTACTRIVTWIKIREKSTGHVFFVFNTHFDHESETARRKSAEMLINAIDTIAGNNHVIVTGDFNDTRKSKMFEKFSGSLTEARIFHDPHFTNPEYTFIGFPFNPEKGNEIDFIFLKNPGHAKTKKYQAVQYNENGLYPSDHLPVLAIIKYPPKDKND